MLWFYIIVSLMLFTLIGMCIIEDTRKFELKGFLLALCIGFGWLIILFVGFVFGVLSFIDFLKGRKTPEKEPTSDETAAEDPEPTWTNMSNEDVEELVKKNIEEENT